MEGESHFEELVRSSDQAVTCPECGAAKVLKQFSSFAVHGAASTPAARGRSGGGWGRASSGAGSGGAPCRARPGRRRSAALRAAAADAAAAPAAAATDDRRIH